MPVFSLLADPGGYEPCSTENMFTDHAYREYWLSHFQSHFDSIVRLAIEHYGVGAAGRAEACKAELVRTLHVLRENPRFLGHLDLLVLDQYRQDVLIKHGIPDPFESLKKRENAAALALYPRVVAELDSHRDPGDALLRALEGIFAGNIFDLGASATTEMFARASPDFAAVRERVHAGRPWLVDHFAAIAGRMLEGPAHRQAIFFVDNAGPDLILGVMPFVRFVARRGTRVVLAANRLPALNDVTVGELGGLIGRVCEIDTGFETLVSGGMIAAVDSGGTAPLIDLSKVSEEVNEHAAGTDLVILEGMGRALESNYEARFTVDAMKLAMIKEEIVAEHFGGKVFDTVCRLDARPCGVCR